MPKIHDVEFGDITVRRNIKATQIRIRVTPNGALSASLPRYAPLFLVKRLIKNSRQELRRLLSLATPKTRFTNGMPIGKAHVLYINIQPRTGFSVIRSGHQIIINAPNVESISLTENDNRIRQAILAALKTEAKKYLPARLEYFAKEYSFKYKKIRYSSASTRWGSYSSTGTVSLNVALMGLPNQLIDYVIIHELSHSKEMNHSHRFWSVVKSIDPRYQQHRRELRQNNPSV